MRVVRLAINSASSGRSGAASGSITPGRSTRAGVDDLRRSPGCHWFGVVASSTTGAPVILRVEGTEQALPVAYDFFAQDRLLVMRPPTGLSNQNDPIYEIVLLPGVRDVDGVRISGSEEEVLANFTVDQDEVAEPDGRILAIYPRDNQRDVSRDTGVVVVLDKPANAASVNIGNVFLRDAVTSQLPGAVLTPLTTLGTRRNLSKT